MPILDLKNTGVMFRNRSCPAVSQICTLIFSSSTWIVLDLKSTLSKSAQGHLPNGQNMVPIELPVRKTQKKAALPYSRIA